MLRAATVIPNVRIDARVPVFDDIRRYDSSPQRYSEDTFSFYNRADGVTWQRIRDTLDAWFAEYPAEHADLRGRFRSKRQGAHVGAFWELYLLLLLRRMGYELDVHPEVPDSSHQPDFEIARPGERLYVEAAVVFSGIVDEDADLCAKAGSWTVDTSALSARRP
jgi:hypothetical protein